MDLLAHVRALHLDHDVARAVAREHGAMDLSERGGGEGSGLEVLEGLGDADAELLLDDALHVGERERLERVLQRLQRVDVLLRHDVGPRGEELAELHVGRPHLLERRRRTPRRAPARPARSRAAVRLGQQKILGVRASAGSPSGRSG